jgi:hypothetical protein
MPTVTGIDLDQRAGLTNRAFADQAQRRGRSGGPRIDKRRARD